MGEAKRRKNLGLPPRETKIIKDKNQQNNINNFLNRYPFLPYIFGISLLVILIIDLIKFYS